MLRLHELMAASLVLALTAAVADAQQAPGAERALRGRPIERAAQIDPAKIRDAITGKRPQTEAVPDGGQGQLENYRQRLERFRDGAGQRARPPREDAAATIEQLNARAPFAVSKSGRYAVACDAQGGLVLCDLANRRRLRSLESSSGSYTLVEISADARWIAAVSRNAPDRVVVWRADNGRQVATLEAAGDKSQLSFADGGKKLRVQAKDGSGYEFRIPDGQMIGALGQGKSEVRGLAPGIGAAPRTPAAAKPNDVVRARPPSEAPPPSADRPPSDKASDKSAAKAAQAPTLAAPAPAEAADKTPVASRQPTAVSPGAAAPDVSPSPSLRDLTAPAPSESASSSTVQAKPRMAEPPAAAPSIQAVPQVGAGAVPPAAAPPPSAAAPKAARAAPQVPVIAPVVPPLPPVDYTPPAPQTAATSPRAMVREPTDRFEEAPRMSVAPSEPAVTAPEAFESVESAISAAEANDDFSPSAPVESLGMPQTASAPPAASEASETARPPAEDAGRARQPAAAVSASDSDASSVIVNYATNRKRLVEKDRQWLVYFMSFFSSLPAFVIYALVLLAALVFPWFGKRTWAALAVGTGAVLLCSMGALEAYVRSQLRDELSGEMYGAGVADVAYGSCEVSVPPAANRQAGEVNRPVSIWVFEAPENAQKHFVLRKVTEHADQQAFFASLEGQMDRAGARAALLFIHGYNVSFEDAVFRTAQLAVDMKFPGVPILYSWPSYADPVKYTFDEQNAEVSIPFFQQFLEDLAAKSGVQRVHIIAHSMGNRVLAGALKQMSPEARERNRQVIEQLVLAAPDIDSRVFKSQVLPHIVANVQHCTLYASSRDRALLISHYFHNYQRLGETEPELVVAPMMDTIDASLVDTSLLGHSYIGDVHSIVSDLHRLVVEGKAAAQRGLESLLLGDMPYWTIKPRLETAAEEKPRR